MFRYLNRITLIFFLGIAGNGFSQLVFNATFGEADGSVMGTDDVDAVTWSSECPECIDDGDFFEVSGGELVGQDTNGPATVTSGVIDISGCDFIEIEFDLWEEGTMEACGTGCNSVDYVQLEYNIDGTGWVAPADAFFCGGECADVLVIQSDDIDGGFLHYTTGCIAGGEELELRITVQAWAASERWIIDNWEVSCAEGPELDAGEDLVVCEGTEIILEADNPDGATLSWSGGVTDGVGFTQEPGTVEYTVTGELGVCSSSDVVSVTVIGAEEASVDPAGPFSVSDPAVALSGSPDGGTWSADCGDCIDPVTGVFDPGSAGPGAWEVCYLIGVAPCEDEACITINVFSGDCLLSGEISFNDPTCFGFSDGSVTMSTSGSTGDVTFVITNEEGEVVNVDNSNTANTLSEGWYYFNVSDEFPCVVIDSVFLDDPDQLMFDVVGVDPLCYGDMTGFAFVENVVNATGDVDAVSYIWSPNPSGDNGIGEDSLLNVGAGEYSITLNDENGCSAEQNFVLTDPDSLRFVQFEADPAYCRVFDYQSGNGVIYASATGGVADYTYLWEDLQTGETTVNSTWGGRNPGDYRMTVVDENGCELVREITVDSLNPVADFDLISDDFTAEWEGTAPLEVEFVNTSEYFSNPNNAFPDTNFIWSFGFGENVLTSDIEETFTQVYSEEGAYDVCLEVINKNGCSDTKCVTIDVFEPLGFVPVNIFTPNQDGSNDVFTFENYAQSVASFTCVIVNRWGREVHSFDSIEGEWDGTLPNGDPAATGVYFYTYEGVTFLGDRFSGQGTVQLVTR